MYQGFSYEWVPSNNLSYLSTKHILFQICLPLRFFAYFLCFLASKYTRQITIAKLRTERNPIFYQFLSILVHFKTFFLCLREVISSLIHDCVYQLVNYCEQTSQLVMLSEQVSANQPQTGKE